MPNFPLRSRASRAGALLLVVVSLVGVAVPPASASTDPVAVPASGAVVTPLPDDALVFHVDAAAPLVDETDGSAEHPLPSLAWGMIFADHYRERGSAVRLVVAPGVYREKLKVGWAGSDPPPLVIESQVPGAATITGADEAAPTPVAGTYLYTIPWQENWGLSPIPTSWSSADVPDGVRRREAVFVDGTPLVQVLTEGELRAGTFYVDEAGDRILVHPLGGSGSLEGRRVEVATRARVLEITGFAASVTVSGFVFEAGAAPLDKHQAYVADSTDVLVEENTFRHSSWGGLGVCCSSRVTLRGNEVRDNGGNGLDTYRAIDIVVESNQVTGNNIRGARHDYYGWSVAGSKNLLLHNAVFRNNAFDANHTRGVWFDTDVEDVLVENTTSCGNLTDGLFIEATQGPITIVSSTFCDNGRAGILVGTSSNVSVHDSTLSGNPYGQLVFSGERHRSWIDSITGLLIEVPDFSSWSLVGNTFESDGAPLIYSPVIPIEDWRALLEAGEMSADANTWIRPSMFDAILIQATAFSMQEWAELTGDTPTIIDGTTPTTTTTSTTSTTTTTSTTSTSTTTTTSTTTQPQQRSRRLAPGADTTLEAKQVSLWPGPHDRAVTVDDVSIQEFAYAGTVDAADLASFVDGVVVNGAVVEGAVLLARTSALIDETFVLPRRCVTGGSRCGVIR